MREFEVLFAKYQPLAQLKKILEKKNVNTGWSEWEHVSNDLVDLQELIQKMEEKNLIIQRYGLFNQVKLKNKLVENLINDRILK